MKILIITKIYNKIKFKMIDNNNKNQVRYKINKNKF